MASSSAAAVDVTAEEMFPLVLEFLSQHNLRASADAFRKETKKVCVCVCVCVCVRVVSCTAPFMGRARGRGVQAQGSNLHWGLGWECIVQSVLRTGPKSLLQIYQDYVSTTGNREKGCVTVILFPGGQ